MVEVTLNCTTKTTVFGGTVDVGLVGDFNNCCFDYETLVMSFYSSANFSNISICIIMAHKILHDYLHFQDE